jgi:pSer/pThr/pTyr-binding forkhead associated (FHA) protein
MENQPPKVPLHQLALRFISGKYQGGEFPLTERSEIVVGRSSDLDMVLVEDMVSRRHARIVCSDNEITIEDLGSTNGTFVNGEKIKRTLLKEGDRVLIGTSILKVIVTDPANGAARRPVAEQPQRATQSGRTMSGAIDEIPLPDLLQLLGTSKKTGVLVVQSDEDIGKIYLKKGNVAFASINDLEDVQPLKSVFRILTWTTGTFELETLEEGPIPGEIDATVTEVLMEGLRQIDELNNIRHRLPDLDARLLLVHPLQAPLRALDAKELDILQLAINFGHVATILNKSPATDLETAQLILKLISQQYLQAQ